MAIHIGADVIGRDGKLGEVSKVVIDPGEDRVVAVVVKRGLIAPEERVLPLDAVGGGSGGELTADISEAEFETLNPFDAGSFRQPDPDYSGPPGHDAAAEGEWNFQTDVVWAMASAAAFAQPGKVFGFPGGEPTRRFEPLPSVDEGSDVFDCDGEKVGEVAAFVFDSESGRPIRLTVRQGFLFHRETEIPGECVASIEDGYVTLADSKDAIERRFH